MNREFPEMKTPADVANFIAIGAIGYHYGELLGMGVAILGTTFFAFMTYHWMWRRTHN